MGKSWCSPMFASGPLTRDGRHGRGWIADRKLDRSVSANFPEASIVDRCVEVNRLSNRGRRRIDLDDTPFDSKFLGAERKKFLNAAARLMDEAADKADLRDCSPYGFGQWGLG